MRGRQGFEIVKVLVIDDAAIHVRLYKQFYASRPAVIDPASLKWVIGHLPLSEREFMSWEPVFLLKTAVFEEELEGYRIWKKDNGGVWEIER